MKLFSHHVFLVIIATAALLIGMVVIVADSTRFTVLFFVRFLKTWPLFGMVVEGGGRSAVERQNETGLFTYFLRRAFEL